MSFQYISGHFLKVNVQNGKILRGLLNFNFFYVFFFFGGGGMPDIPDIY